ncbi:hypothetical protein ACFQ6Q_00625 [Streptomyces sp. NPDC056437]|uniref:hypothetical protein n=1 Tax=Streptomyces sp. NPDC056437 TaxID=3345816 RepID=UPI00367AE0C9
MQWTEDTTMATLKDFANDLVQLNDVDRVFSVYDHLHDVWIPFEYGDWIIRGVQGELYPCKGDVFAVTYEPVPAEVDITIKAPAPGSPEAKTAGQRIVREVRRLRGGDL